MRRSVLSLTMGFALFALTSEPAVAETCTGYYQKCSHFCSTNSRKIATCRKECTTLRQQCMKTGQWIGRGGKDKNVEKR